VLTAALSRGRSPSRTYVGNDANEPTSGRFYASLEFRIHERYSPRNLANDIALVRLQSPVSGVTPIPYNTANLGPYEGQTVFRLGFGAVEGIEESGKGLKRSSSSSISQVDPETFTSAYNGTGTCFGDSGGPALLTINDTLSIVGVTSAGAICQEVDCDPCKAATTSLRVDTYGTWIDATLSDSAAIAVSTTD
jgi:secreted trypsin-like serine protease